MISETTLNSMLLLDKCLAKTIKAINKLEDVEYKKIFDSSTIYRINAILNQIYNDRTAKNYRSAIRKCIFLKKYIEREKRISDGSK